MASRLAIQSAWKVPGRFSHFNVQKLRTSVQNSPRYIFTTAHKLSTQEEDDLFSIKEILPPQDAFAKRHIGPRKQYRNEMLRILNYDVR